MPQGVNRVIVDRHRAELTADRGPTRIWITVSSGPRAAASRRSTSNQRPRPVQEPASRAWRTARYRPRPPRMAVSSSRTTAEPCLITSAGLSLPTRVPASCVGPGEGASEHARRVAHVDLDRDRGQRTSALTCASASERQVQRLVLFLAAHLRGLACFCSPRLGPEPVAKSAAASGFGLQPPFHAPCVSTPSATLPSNSMFNSLASVASASHYPPGHASLGPSGRWIPCLPYLVHVAKI